MDVIYSTIKHAFFQVSYHARTRVVTCCHVFSHVLGHVTSASVGEDFVDSLPVSAVGFWLRIFENC